MDKKKVKWKDYKQLIVSLSLNGLSSTQIAKVIAKTEDIPDSSDRRIRKLVNKWIPDAKEPSKTEVKVLVFDIETAPMKAYVWGRWKQNIQESHIIKDWFMISWAAKWLFKDEVMSDVLNSKEAIRGNDRRITKTIWRLLDEADVVIAHNGVKFDIRKLNARFLKYEMYLPSPYTVIDTLLHARKKFALSSNRLDYISKILGFEGKIDTTFELWNRCLKGHKEALTLMDTYCKNDVQVLEDVYLKLRPYIQPHPNIGINIVEEDVEVCPSCGSKDLTVDGLYTTTVNAFEALKCNSCNSWSRRRKSSLTKLEKKSILSSIPR